MSNDSNGVWGKNRFNIFRQNTTPLHLAVLQDHLEIVRTLVESDALQKAGRKLTIASVGNLENVPYADELK